MPARTIDFTDAQLGRLERDARKADLTVSALVKRIVDGYYAGEDRLSAADISPGAAVNREALQPA